ACLGDGVGNILLVLQPTRHHERAVFDGGHLCGSSIDDTWCAVTVGCNALADAVGVVDQGDHLFAAKLCPLRRGVRCQATTTGHDLDVVCAGLDLFADCPLDVLDGITFNPEEIAVPTG